MTNPNDEGRCAPGLLAQEPVGTGMPSPDELVLDTLRRESESLLTECTDKQKALFVRIVGNSLDKLSEEELRSAYDLLRRTVWKNRNGRVVSS